MTWGYHLVIDLHKCAGHTIRCPKHIASFSKKLVKTIDMIPFGGPIIVKFGKEDKKGYTLVQLIETSNIMGHFCESTNDAYLDIFSCKPYNKDIAKSIVQAYFQPKLMRARMLHRDAGKYTPELK